MHKLLKKLSLSIFVLLFSFFLESCSTPRKISKTTAEQFKLTKKKPYDPTAFCVTDLQKAKTHFQKLGIKSSDPMQLIQELRCAMTKNNLDLIRIKLLHIPVVYSLYLKKMCPKFSDLKQTEPGRELLITLNHLIKKSSRIPLSQACQRTKELEVGELSYLALHGIGWKYIDPTSNQCKSWPDTGANANHLWCQSYQRLILSQETRNLIRRQIKCGKIKEAEKFIFLTKVKTHGNVVHKLLPLLADVYLARGDIAASNIVNLAYKKTVQARKDRIKLPTRIFELSGKNILQCKSGETFKDLSTYQVLRLACYKGEVKTKEIYWSDLKMKKPEIINFE